MMLNKVVIDYADTSFANSLTVANICGHLAANTIGLIFVAYQRITARFLIDFVMSAPTEEDDLDTVLLKENFYTETYMMALKKEYELRSLFEKNMPEEEWKNFNGPEYRRKLFIAVPERPIGDNADLFFAKIYQLLNKQSRILCDMAFSGLIFSILNSSDFPTLLKDKSMDTSGLSIDEKMDIELDHEALYAYSQSKMPLELGQE